MLVKGIPRQRFIELAVPMDEQRFEEVEALILELRPDAADYLSLFFGKDLRRRSRPARWAA